MRLAKQAAQAIRKIGEIGWHPTFFLAATSTSVSTVLKPAGLEYAKGIITTYYMKDPNDPQWQNDKGVQDWHAFMKNYLSDGNIQDQSNVYGYTVAQAMEEVIRQCGDDLTRENIMKQATNLDLALPMLLPGNKGKNLVDRLFPDRSPKSATLQWRGVGAFRRGDRGLMVVRYAHGAAVHAPDERMWRIHPDDAVAPDGRL